MSVERFGLEERERWDAFVAGHPEGHLLQSFAWGELKARFGWEPVRLALVEAGQIRATAQILLRRWPFFTIAYVPRGPVVDWGDEGAVRALLRALADVARRRNALFLRIEPNHPHPLPAPLDVHGFRPGRAVQPQSSLVVDLTADEEALLARMKPKTRYNIRLAVRRAVTVRSATGPAEVPTFYQLLQETARRDRFGIHTLAYYQAFYRLFNQAGNAELFFAEREGVVLASLWVAGFGPEAIYMYGASRTEGQEHMPSYLLQWEAMRWARARGCTRYDLWGIPDSVLRGQDPREQRRKKNVRDGLWGVYRFKQGFGGNLVRTVGAWDLPLSPVLYRLYRCTGR
jgi:lipid II:glycine glycyltransferase (peptidoglycan interpeptide bridge formation enzyme)